MSESDVGNGPNPLYGGCFEGETQELADLRRSQAAQIAALKTVMIAAAEEIASHWQAHCDAEGYGPQNLQRRLEEGIASEYGYTAGAFEKLRAENEALRNALKVAGGALRYHQEQTRLIHSTHAAIKTIDAAIAGKEKP